MVDAIEGNHGICGMCGAKSYIRNNMLIPKDCLDKGAKMSVIKTQYFDDCMKLLATSKSDELKIKEEFEYLLWFFQTADFGPSDTDVRCMMEQQYEKETGKKIPEDYKI